MDFSNYNEDNTILGNEMSYSSVVIQPPEKAKTHGPIYKNLVIDSRERDILKYPDPNNYKIQFNDEYLNVLSMELIYGKIPNDFYNIIKNNYDKGYKGNNIFYITFDNGPLEQYEIFEGHYNKDKLINTLNGDFGDLFNKKYLYFILNEFNQKLMMYCPTKFIYNLNYDNCENPCSINKVLGYNDFEYVSNEVLIDFNNLKIEYLNNSENSDTFEYKESFIIRNIPNNPKNFLQKNIYVELKYLDASTSSIKNIIVRINYVNDCSIIFSVCNNSLIDKTVINYALSIKFYFIMGSNSVDLNDYLILQIPEFHTIEAVNDATDRSFMIIPKLPNDEFNKGKAPVNEGNIKYFSPPKDRIQSITIKFKNYNGNIVNFNGQEHFLMFKVQALNQPMKYNNFVPS